MSLEIIASLSRLLGSKKGYVLAGGGNTSWKDERYLHIKPSGVALANLAHDDFVKMDRQLIRSCIEKTAALNGNERESLCKRMSDYAVIFSKNGRRPSVEAPLHELFDQSLVVHLHPTLVNAMTCGAKGKEICKKLFPDALWMDVVDPGASLAIEAQSAFDAYRAKNNGKSPAVLFIQNHGVFVGADSAEEMEKLYNIIFEKLAEQCASAGITLDDACGAPFDMDFVRENAPLLRGYLAADGVPAAVMAMDQLELPDAPFSPDHIVYSKSFALVTDSITRESIEKFKKQHGYLPMAVKVPGKALFACGRNVKVMRTAAEFLRDSATILKLSNAFGGPRTLDDRARSFIENWEMESYRTQVSFGGAAGALNGKIALVTGGAQGFGYGIAESLIAAGAHVIVADLNKEGAEAAAKKLGANASSAAVDVSDENSVQMMADSVIARFGGLDLFVANAGVLKAGSVKTMSKKDWDFVTAVNYTGYFLCVKHFAPVMALQNSASGLWSDIVQINSKSGLAGSNKNAAYAAGKFGTIGMTQSFALELVADKIKVNSICPGNYYEGPLWSDPECGLFRQYFDAGKVAGAKSIEDVKQYYLSQSPIKRGCYPEDVARAIIYSCTQQFETGQAIPVTGGQVMLN